MNFTGPDAAARGADATAGTARQPVTQPVPRTSGARLGSAPGASGLGLWKYLLDWKGREAVFLLDSTFGQGSIAVSKGFDQVISLVPSREAGERAKELARHYGCDNITVVQSVSEVEETLFNKIRNVALHDIARFMSLAQNPTEIFRSIGKVIASAHNATTLYVSGMRDANGTVGWKGIPALVNRWRRHRTGSIRVLFEPTLSGVSEIIPVDTYRKYFLRARPLRSRMVKYAKRVWRGGKALGEGEYLYRYSSAQTFFEILLDTIRSESIVSGGLRVDYIKRANPLNAIVSMTDETGNGCVARIAMDGYANDRTKMAYENMETVLKKHDGFGGTVPVPMGSWDIGGEPVYLEKRVVGRCFEARKSMDDRLYRLGVEWISAFHVRTMEKRRCTTRDFWRLVEGPVSRFASCLDTCGKGKMDRMVAHLSARLLEREFPFVFMHGDYKLEHILFRRDLSGIAGVIDWDLGCEQGVPLLDVLNLIFFHRANVSRKPCHVLLKEFMRACSFSPAEQRVLKAYLSSVRMDTEGKAGVFLALFWLYYVSMRAMPCLWNSVEWRQNHVNPILDILSDDEWWSHHDCESCLGK